MTTHQRADTPVCGSLGSPATPAVTPVSGQSLHSLFVCFQPFSSCSYCRPTLITWYKLFIYVFRFSTRACLYVGVVSCHSRSGRWRSCCAIFLVLYSLVRQLVLNGLLVPFLPSKLPTWLFKAYSSPTSRFDSVHFFVVFSPRRLIFLDHY